MCPLKEGSTWNAWNVPTPGVTSQVDKVAPPSPRTAGVPLLRVCSEGDRSRLVFFVFVSGVAVDTPGEPWLTGLC